MPNTRWGQVALGGLLVVGLLGAACGGQSGKDEVRVLQIEAQQGGCTPTALAVEAGERVSFEVTNNANQDRELEGIDGTKVEEVLIPKGKTRAIPFTVPKDATTLRLKCYSPAGPATIIEVAVAADAEGEHNYTTKETPRATVTVDLDSFMMKPDVASVAAGPIKFVAKNVHRRDVHELAVLRVQGDGSLENTGEVEDLPAGTSGEIVLNLPAGKYQLACLIAKGQAGSTVDHYQQGMVVPFEVK